MVRWAPAEVFLAPAQDNPAGRPVSAQDSQVELGQAVQAAGAGYPAQMEGEWFQDLHSFFHLFYWDNPQNAVVIGCGLAAAVAV
jgi:hypothetical protein